MATLVTAFSKQAYTTGPRTFERAVPVGCTGARVALDRTSLAGAEVPDIIKLDVWLSYDNAVTWEYRGGVGIPDGVAGVRTESGFTPDFPQPNNANRRVRIVFDTARTVTVGITASLLP